MSFLTAIRIRNYRSLAQLDLELHRVNVFFGPNGAGKSSILDAIWFLRGCAAQGVEATAAERDHGIGLLYADAPEGSNISIAISTPAVRYELTFGFLSGRMDPLPGERLIALHNQTTLIDRKAGSDRAAFHHGAMGADATFSLREPERISLPRYLDYDLNNAEATGLNNLLRYAHFYHSRSMRLFALRKHGSEAGYENWLWNLGENLWSVLRNLQGRKAVDDRYETIVFYMRKSFPGFKDLLVEATSPTTVYGSFVETGLSQPVRASGASDGHLQMLLLLTALFAEGAARPTLIMFDEPELSLHPWALAVLAEAIEDAASKWQRQVLISTHSPVLLSQFAPDRVLAVEPGKDGTRVRRLSEIEEVKDVLAQYSPGSLYMAELVGAQSAVFSEK
jgi:predicted ATPase